MKKILKKLGLTAMVVTLAFAFAGCGKKEESKGSGSKGSSEKTIDAEDLADTLISNVTFDTTLEKATDAQAKIMAAPASEDTAVTLYLGSGDYADEILIMTAKDADAASAELDAANSHVSEKEKSFEAYIPAEATKASNAVVVQEGNSIIVCITNDYENAKTQIEDYIGK